MKVLRIILPIVVLLIAGYSCKKYDKPVVPVYAGIYDSTFYHVEIATPVGIALTWDSINMYGTGSSSLDLNNDGEADVTMYLTLLSDDSLHRMNEEPWLGRYPNLRIKFSSYKFRMLTYVLNEKISIQTFAKDLVYGQRMDTFVDFTDNGNGYVMWRALPDIADASFGPMYYLKDIVYIAFKYSSKFGWIKLDMTDNKNPIFLGFAVQR
jgi:hypothetical protein